MRAIIKKLLTQLGLFRMAGSFNRLLDTAELLRGTRSIPLAEIEQTIIDRVNRNIRKPYRNRQAKAKLPKIKKQAQQILKSEVVYFKSWITMARKKQGSNEWDLRMSGKWYTIKGLKDFLITRMRMSKYVGKLLWNTLWLHKRKWTTGTKRKKSLFTSDLDPEDYKEIQNYIKKRQKIPRGLSKTVSTSAKWGRMTDTLSNLLNSLE